ncbi:NfeD family protein [Geminocystis sp.]|uniref:NfeD family protein n=1 Tax=Geminocystis sp. TaxID=2664100 RepID=UPI003593A718
MSSPVFLWLIIGAILCLMELIFPTAFVEFAMGLSAIMVAGLALLIPYDNVLIILWMVISVVLVMMTKKFIMPKKKDPILEQAQEGITITAIEAGKIGQVMYEGNSWSAVCEDENIKIFPDEKVYIVSRNGNTLSVLPTRFLKNSSF